MNGRSVLLAAFALFAVAGCGAVTSGEVVDRRHEDTRIYYDTVQDYAWMQKPKTTCSGTGSSYKCTTTSTSEYTWVGSHQEQRVDDEDWVLVLRNGGGDTGEVEVSESDWREHPVGSWWGEER
jgi:hypothetical protein